MHHIFIISYSTFSLCLWFIGSLIHGLEIRLDCHRHENISILYLYTRGVYLPLCMHHQLLFNIHNIHHSRMGNDYPAPFAFFSAYFVFQKKAGAAIFFIAVLPLAFLKSSKNIPHRPLTAARSSAVCHLRKIHQKNRRFSFFP